MRVYANIMTKNEELLLNELLPIWNNYPVEKFIFYNDNSTDGSVNLIKSYLGDRAVILNDNLVSPLIIGNNSSIIDGV